MAAVRLVMSRYYGGCWCPILQDRKNWGKGDGRTAQHTDTCFGLRLEASRTIAFGEVATLLGTVSFSFFGWTTSFGITAEDLVDYQHVA